MDRELEITLEEPTTQSSRQALTDALVAHNATVWGEPHYTTVGFFIRAPDGTLQAGLSGRLRWGWLFIEMLWVDESLRNRGIGGRLLRAAEDLARARGGVAMHLDSGGTRALPFYLRHGFEIVGRMEGFPPGADHHYLRKFLAAPRPVDSDPQ